MYEQITLFKHLNYGFYVALSFYLIVLVQFYFIYHQFPKASNPNNAILLHLLYYFIPSHLHPILAETTSSSTINISTKTGTWHRFLEPGSSCGYNVQGDQCFCPYSVCLLLHYLMLWPHLISRTVTVKCTFLFKV